MDEAKRARREPGKKRPWDGVRPPIAKVFLKAAETVGARAHWSRVRHVGRGRAAHPQCPLRSVPGLRVWGEAPRWVNDSLAVFLTNGDGELGGSAWWAGALRPL